MKSIMVYKIKDWSEHFENSKSRERISCSFVCVPNKQHGLSFSRIMSEKDGAMIYGIWCLLLGACSQQKKPREGWLTHDGYETGTPWTPEDLALKFRRPKNEIEKALQVISSEDVGWIISIQCPPSTCSVPADCPPGIVKEGREENRKEEKKGLRPPEALNINQIAAKEVIDYLNEKTGATLPYDKSLLSFISGRLNQGHSLADCKLVIDSKTKDWGKDPGFSKNLVPSVLFKSDKFHEYLSSAKKNGVKGPVLRPSYEELKAQGIVK